MSPDRARELLREGLTEPIVAADGRTARIVIGEDGAVQVWRADARGEIESVVEQPVAPVARGEVDDERYALLVAGIRLAVAQGLAAGREDLFPAHLVQPDVLLDPRVRTADDVSRVLLDPVALADCVGPVQVGAFLSERGLPPVPAATAARLHRFLSDDVELARAAARELVREDDRAAIPALLVTLESWVGFVADPVGFTRDGRNVHQVLARGVSRLMRAAATADERARVAALIESGLIGG